MIQYSDGTLEYEKDDFIDFHQWAKYEFNKNEVGATFQVKPDVWESRTIVDYPNPNFESLVEDLNRVSREKIDKEMEMEYPKKHNPVIRQALIERYGVPSKKETVADALNETFGGMSAPKGIMDEFKDIQPIYNKRESDFADAVRYGTFNVEAPKEKSIFHDVISSWKSLMYSITGLRIVHKDDICNCEDY